MSSTPLQRDAGVCRGGSSSGRGALVVGAVLMVASAADGQIAVRRYVVPEGGGVIAAGNIRLTSSVGQPTAGGPMVAGPYRLSGGFLMPNTCRADFNGVGGLTIQDIFDYLNAWFAGQASADFNGLNGLTIQDIFDFLNAWFMGC